MSIYVLDCKIDYVGNVEVYYVIKLFFIVWFDIYGVSGKKG